MAVIPPTGSTIHFLFNYLLKFITGAGYPVPKTGDAANKELHNCMYTLKLRAALAWIMYDIGSSWRWLGTCVCMYKVCYTKDLLCVYRMIHCRISG